MITATDVYKQVIEDNPLYDQFIIDHVLPAFQESFGKPVKVYFSSIYNIYDDIFNSGLLRKALGRRGFDVEVDQLDGQRFMAISIPPQGE